MREGEEVTGLVLKTMPIGERDRRVTILTREKGKLSCFARGAARPGYVPAPQAVPARTKTIKTTKKTNVPFPFLIAVPAILSASHCRRNSPAALHPFFLHRDTEAFP